MDLINKFIYFYLVAFFSIITYHKKYIVPCKILSSSEFQMNFYVNTLHVLVASMPIDFDLYTVYICSEFSFQYHWFLFIAFQMHMPWTKIDSISSCINTQNDFDSEANDFITVKSNGHVNAVQYSASINWFV